MGCLAAGADRSRFLDSSWTDLVGPRQQTVNSDLSDHLLTYSLTLPTVRQSCPPPPSQTKRSTVDTTWQDTYTHSTYPDGTHTYFLVPVPVQVPVQVQDHPGQQGLLPPSLNTDLHLFRPCCALFSTGPVVPSFSTPISPPFHPTHLPTSSRPQRQPACPIILFLYCSLTRHRTSFSWRQASLHLPPSLFGRVLLSSSLSLSSFPSRTTTHHPGLLLRTSPFRVSADPQT